MRAAMAAEVMPRYADRQETLPLPASMSTEPEEVVMAAVARLHDRPVGHVALRRQPIGDGTHEPATILEVKNVFVHPAARGRGVARTLLRHAEHVARELGASRLVLQTGDRQPDAVQLYATSGYHRVGILTPYVSLPYSLCFAKNL